MLGFCDNKVSIFIESKFSTYYFFETDLFNEVNAKAKNEKFMLDNLYSPICTICRQYASVSTNNC